MQCRLVAYYRVSTRQQGKSGLGIEAQQHAIKEHAARSGCEVVGEYREVESGRRDDRPELARAIAHARAAKATLVVAKLDRLSRRAAYILRMLDEARDVPFVICDLPGATRLTIGVYALVAEEESAKISERTKAALAALKARGVKLGAKTPKTFTDEEHKRGHAAALAARRAAADAAYEHLRPIIHTMRESGHGFHAIAQHLNAKGYTTRRGCKWTSMQVQRVEKTA